MGNGDINGAYGAGLLKGWSAAGSRPRFRIVTGVSTGALGATYAFLGKDYDKKLEQAYTTIRTEDIMTKRSILAWPYSDSLADTAPLKKLIARFHPDDVLQAVAQEHAKGRRLYVMTTNLDVDRAVIWDLGAIASHLLAGEPVTASLPPALLLALGSASYFLRPTSRRLVSGTC